MLVTWLEIALNVNVELIPATTFQEANTADRDVSVKVMLSIERWKTSCRNSQEIQTVVPLAIWRADKVVTIHLRTTHPKTRGTSLLAVLLHGNREATVTTEEVTTTAVPPLLGNSKVADTIATITMVLPVLVLVRALAALLLGNNKLPLRLLHRKITAMADTNRAMDKPVMINQLHHPLQLAFQISCSSMVVKRLHHLRRTTLLLLRHPAMLLLHRLQLKVYR